MRAMSEMGQERPIGPYGNTSGLALIAFLRAASRRVATCQSIGDISPPPIRSPHQQLRETQVTELVQARGQSGG